jgi:hypothetical protein
MNAYKLAEKLMNSLTNEYDCDDYMVMAAELLRQQAHHINELDALLDKKYQIIKELKKQ